jgi:hypothetical protein
MGDTVKILLSSSSDSGDENLFFMRFGEIPERSHLTLHEATIVSAQMRYAKILWYHPKLCCTSQVYGCAFQGSRLTTLQFYGL